MEIGAQPHFAAGRGAHAPLLDAVGTGHERDAFGGVVELEARAIAPVRQSLFDEPPGHQAALIRGQVEFEAVALERTVHRRIPARSCRKKRAFLAARRLGVSERVAMIEAAVERCECAAPAEVDAARRGQADALKSIDQLGHDVDAALVDGERVDAKARRQYEGRRARAHRSVCVSRPSRTCVSGSMRTRIW